MGQRQVKKYKRATKRLSERMARNYFRQGMEVVQEMSLWHRAGFCLRVLFKRFKI